MKDEVCCPVFNPVPWDGKTHIWTDKPFLFMTVPQIFHMPIPGLYGNAITRLWDTAKENNIAPETKDFLLLSCDPSPWKSELFLSVTSQKEGVKTVSLSGTFISKVFDGPYQNVPQYIEGIEDYAHEQHKKIGKMYFYYTTCPKCAKKYGHNFIIVFAEVIA